MLKSTYRSIVVSCTITLVSMFSHQSTAQEFEDIAERYRELHGIDREAFQASVEYHKCDPIILDGLREEALVAIRRETEIRKLEEPGEVFDYECLEDLMSLNLDLFGSIRLPDFNKIFAKGVCRTFRKHVMKAINKNLNIGLSLPGFSVAGQQILGSSTARFAVSTGSNASGQQSFEVQLGNQRLEEWRSNTSALGGAQNKAGAPPPNFLKQLWNQSNDGADKREGVE